MDIEKTKFSGCYLITPKTFYDNRGFLIEVYNSVTLKEAGISAEFPYSIESQSKKNVIRGLHFQWDPPVGKFVRVVAGGIFFVAADIRKKSETFGKWISVELTSENRKAVYIKPGFAAGFCALTDHAYVQYHYTAPHDSKGESNILWSDKDLKINWPIKDPILSERDSNAKTFKEWLSRPESNKF